MFEYDDLDWLYEVLYAGHDTFFWEGLFFENHRRLLSKNFKIHDAACGNGIQAIALAKQGYHVSMSDISEKMVEIAINNSKLDHISLNTFVSSWSQLPARGEQYDLIFCSGNSISHSLDSEERKNNLVALKKCLNNGGVLVIDSRNWERMIGCQYEILEERNYRGKKYIPIYIWNQINLNEKAFVSIVFIESDGKKMNTYEKKLTFTPFGHDQIEHEAEDIGFTKFHDSYAEDCRYYFLYLRNND